MPRSYHYWLFGVFLVSLVATLRAADGRDADGFVLPNHLEATICAKAPMFYNPTNIDIDERGRVWVTEAVNYHIENTPGRKSDDGRIYVGGFAMAINSDGRGLSVYAQNFATTTKSASTHLTLSSFW